MKRDLAFDDRALHGTHILYWCEDPMDVAAYVSEWIAAIFTGRRWPNPSDCVNRLIPLRKRQLVAKLLAAGEPIESYFGCAKCRICGVELGSKDLAGYGFVWPEGAEHYLLEHSVWTPDCDKLFDAARKN